MLSRLVVMMLAFAVVSPLAEARQASMSEEEQRAELASVIEERVRLHERRIRELEAQLKALQDGAELATVRESLRQDQPADRDRAVPGRPRPDAETQRGPRDEARERVRRRLAEGEDSPTRERDRRRPDDRPLTPEMIDGMLLMIRTENPAFADRLEKLREERAEVFDRIMRRMMSELPQDDDELASLGLRVRASELALRDLASRARKSPEEAQALTDDIRAALNAAADARLAYERARIERDGKQLERRTQFLETMEARRSEFIEQRLAAILSGEDLVKIPRLNEGDRPGDGRRGPDPRHLQRENRPTPPPQQ